MACMRLGSKPDAFKRHGQAWFSTTGLPTDIVVEVEDVSFHLHKFPLISRSEMLERLIRAAEEEDYGPCIELPDFPGGSKTFELVVKFCYGVKLELTASNVVHLRCASEHLGMTEKYGEGNLIMQTENFLNLMVLKSWKDSIITLKACEDLLPQAEDLCVVKKCIESVVAKACSGPTTACTAGVDHDTIQSPGGTILWNGISISRPRSCTLDWWYEDVSCLSLGTYKRLISALEYRGIGEEIIAGSLVSYAKRYLPGLNRRENICEPGCHRLSLVSEEEQRHLVEEIDSLLPMQPGLIATRLLFRLLRTAMILHASQSCLLNIERRIGMQLDKATLEDLLMPNFSNLAETLYDVDCIQRILDHFLTMDQEPGAESPYLIEKDQLICSSPLTPVSVVSKLIDGYLAEVASDINLKPDKFQSLAATIPDYARSLDDGLYHAIDVYLKEHPWLTNSEREQLCGLLDCQKLSLEACTHAAQNERLPLRIVVQVLFFEQMQLKSSVAGCFLLSDNLDVSRPGRGHAIDVESCDEAATRENNVLKMGMDTMRKRVSELEGECSIMRKEIEKLSLEKSRSSSLAEKLGFKICSADERAVITGKKNGGIGKSGRLLTKISKYRESYLEE